MATETPYGSGEGGPNITPQTMDAYPPDVQETAEPAVEHIVSAPAPQRVVGAPIGPAAQLAFMQARMATITAKIATQQANQVINQNNAAAMAAALDALNYAQKDCQSKIDTLNAVLGNPTNPDPALP